MVVRRGNPSLPASDAACEAVAKTLASPAERERGQGVRTDRQMPEVPWRPDRRVRRSSSASVRCRYRRNAATVHTVWGDRRLPHRLIPPRVWPLPSVSTPPRPISSRAFWPPPGRCRRQDLLSRSGPRKSRATTPPRRTSVRVYAPRWRSRARCIAARHFRPAAAPANRPGRPSTQHPERQAISGFLPAYHGRQAQTPEA